MVQVLEDYRDFDPPANLRGRIEMLLSGVAPAHTQGLGSVVLTNRAALSREVRKGKTWSRGRKVSLIESQAFYYRAWKGQPAWIRLIVDNALADIPAWALRVPVVQTVALAIVLYHEVGHHIHATRRPEHREREDVADEWSRRLTRRLVFRRYWYVALPLGLIAHSLRWIRRRRRRGPRARAPRP